MREIVLAADLGGTNMRMAAIDRHGRILYQTKCETPRLAVEADEIVRAIVKLVGECRSKLDPDLDIIALSLAVPSGVDYQNGIIIEAPNLPCLNGFRVAAALEIELNLRVMVENDANAAAIGENWQGASKGFANSICVMLGTGVGGGIIIDGKIMRGVDGMAGEIGHICLEPFGHPCGCGSRGCTEQYTSATAIVRQTKELENQYPNSLLQNKSRLTSLDVFEAGQAGDELALEVFRRVGFYLGLALGGLINIFNPEIIVLGGGAASGWELFMPPLKDQIRSRAFRASVERANIVRAKLDDDAGILGAAKLGFSPSKSILSISQFNQTT
jgi:glucokinase